MAALGKPRDLSPDLTYHRHRASARPYHPDPYRTKVPASDHSCPHSYLASESPSTEPAEPYHAKTHTPHGQHRTQAHTATIQKISP